MKPMKQHQFIVVKQIGEVLDMPRFLSFFFTSKSKDHSTDAFSHNDEEEDVKKNISERYVYTLLTEQI